MDIQSLYYFQEVVKDMNITKTAERLFMSQQTLSNHIKRMEEYFGIPLLYRKPKLSLTYAGEMVLSFADYVNSKQRNLMDLIADIKKNEKGVIRFGSSVLRANAILPYVLNPFSEQFPNVEMRITNGMSEALTKATLSGNLDASIILETSPARESWEREINYIHLLEETIYLCVSNHLLEHYYGEQSAEIKARSLNGADLADFEKLPFAILTNRMGSSINGCFETAGYKPKIYTTSGNVQFTTSLAIEGLAASFVIKTSILSSPSLFSTDLNFFPLTLNGQVLKQNIYLIHRKDRYLNLYLKYFLDLILRFASYLDQIPTEQILHSDTYTELMQHLKQSTIPAERTGLFEIKN